MANANLASTSRGWKFGAGTASGWGVAALFAAMACSGAVLSGCAGLATPSNATPTPQEAVQISPSSISFAAVAPGQKATQIATLTNNGTESVTITQLALSAKEFSASGLATPLSIGPGQSAKFQVTYTGTTSGDSSGTLTAMTSRGSGSSKVHLRGSSGKSGSTLSLSAAALNFGNVLVNGSSTQAVTLKNSGLTDIQVSQISVTGGAFTTTGLAAPATIPAGQSVVLQAKFAPTAAGAVTGAIAISSDAQTATSTISLNGTGVAATYTMSLSPASVNFANVTTGSSATQNVQLSNTGNSSVIVSQIAASGTGISMSGAAAPLTIAPAQSVTLAVKFAPTTSGAATGSLTVTNNEGVNALAAVTGTGVQPGLSLTPSSASFGSVVSGNTNSQTIQVTNSGTASLTISQATVTGPGFTLSGLAVLLTSAAGQSGNFNLQFAPNTAGSVSGSISI